MDDYQKIIDFIAANKGRTFIKTHGYIEACIPPGWEPARIANFIDGEADLNSQGLQRGAVFDMTVRHEDSGDEMLAQVRGERVEGRLTYVWHVDGIVAGRVTA